jgi:hypothetical protein
MARTFFVTEREIDESDIIREFKLRYMGCFTSFYTLPMLDQPDRRRMMLSGIS